MLNFNNLTAIEGKDKNDLLFLLSNDFTLLEESDFIKKFNI